MRKLWFVYIPCWCHLGLRELSIYFFFYFLSHSNKHSVSGCWWDCSHSKAGTEILCNNYIIFIIWNIFIFMFWIIIGKCTTFKLIKKSSTPETMDIKISLQNTARDKEEATVGSWARQKCGWFSFGKLALWRVRTLETV